MKNVTTHKEAREYLIRKGAGISEMFHLNTGSEKIELPQGYLHGLGCRINGKNEYVAFNKYND